MAKNTRDYSGIENFPEGATIQKKGKHLYVIRRSCIYDPKKKRGRDVSRETLGQVVDGVFYTNTQYRQIFQRGMVKRRVPLVPKPADLPVPRALAEISDSLLTQLLTADVREVRVGILPIFHRILCETGMVQDLEDCFGKDAAKLIFCLASFYICSGFKASRYFGDWADGRYLPIDIPFSDRDVSRMLKELGIAKESMEKLFTCRIARNLKDGPMLLSVDSTTIAWNCKDSEDAKVGHSKEGGTRKQISLVVTFNSTSHQPILCRRLPGNIPDMKSALDFFTRLEEYGVQQECRAMFDRGYYSEENIHIAVKSKVKAIFAAPFRSELIIESIRRAMDIFSGKAAQEDEESLYLKDGKVQATTIRRMLKNEGRRFAVYVHVFRSRIEEAREREDLYERLNIFEDLWKAKKNNVKVLEKDDLMKFFTVSEDKDGIKILQRDEKAIAEELKTAGIFVDVTTWRSSAQECYDAYQRRRDIERIFRSGKSNAALNTHRVHNDLTSEGKILIMFVALHLLEDIKRRLAMDWMKTLKGGTEHVEIAANTFDFDRVLERLSSVGYLMRNSTGTILVREVTNEQKRMAVACGCRGIYDSGYTYTDPGI